MKQTLLIITALMLVVGCSSDKEESSGGITPEGQAADVEEERSLEGLGIDEMAFTKCDSCIDGSKLDLRKVPERWPSDPAKNYIAYESAAKGESWSSKKPYSGPVCFYQDHPSSSRMPDIRRLQGTFKDGMAVGKWTEWGASGVKVSEMNLSKEGVIGIISVNSYHIASSFSERVGKWTYWSDHYQYPKGMKTKEEIYRMDGKDVICEITEYHRGYKSSEYTEINSKQVGKYVSWSGGQKTSEGIFEKGDYRAGSKSGKWTFWASDGKDTYEIIYKNDREWDGTKVEWYNDRRREEITYKEGREVKNIQYYDNLQKSEEVIRNEDGRVKLFKEWFENGQQKITRTKQGDTIILTYWIENGNKSREIITTDDKFDYYRQLYSHQSQIGFISNGKISDYTKDGTLSYVRIYENGELIDKIEY